MLLRRIDENWLEGQLDGKVGIFPASHVKIELSNPTLSHENALASSGRPYAIALYSFKGDQPGDLPFNKGELVELVGTVGSGWLRGGMNGRTGIFPASFVEILKSTDALLSTETVEVQVNGIDVDAYGEQSEESRPTPKPRPQRTSAPPTSSLMPNGSIPTSFGSHSDIKEEILIPSRSPPAPPTSSSPEYEVVDHEPKEYNSSTLPKPKPRKKLGRRTSVSNTELQLNSLESNLTIELKMLESAQNLLLVCQNETKMEKLRERMKTHQTNIEKLKQQIEEAKGQHATLLVTLVCRNRHGRIWVIG